MTNSNHLNPVLRLFCTALLAATLGCASPYHPQKEKDEPPKQEEIKDNDPVAQDSTLEVASWNLEWFGDKTFGHPAGNGNGPADELQQTKNIIRVADSLKADLYAFQEIYSQQALNSITRHMSGYRGFVARHISWIQKTAFVYNTNTIDSVSSGAITQGQDKYAWANGRYPLFFKFRYSYKNKSRMFYAVVIHAKAFGDKESYQRRKKAAEELHTYLSAQKPTANIIMAGDYNDDVDKSIYTGSLTPYASFTEDTSNFRILTKPLSQVGESSTVKYSDMIDHITISNEIFSLYVPHSTAVYKEVNAFIPDYGTSTSDHYPVWAKFDIMR